MFQEARETGLPPHVRNLRQRHPVLGCGTVRGVGALLASVRFGSTAVAAPPGFLRFLIVACAFLIQGLWMIPDAQAVSESSQLAVLSRNLHASRIAGNFLALQRFAEGASAGDRAFALFSVGMARYRAKDYPAAERALEGVSAGPRWLGEYAAYYRSRSIVLAADFERSVGALERFEADFPGSRFRAASERLRVESLLRLRRLDEARAITSAASTRLEEPVRLYLAGRVEHVDGNLKTAVGLYRQTYYNFPFSDQAAAAESHLERIRAAMGRGYPAAPALWRLERADKLHAGRSYAGASAEYTRALNAGLSGADRDRAIVGRGSADYHRRLSSQAYSALAKARPSVPEIDAQRLYLLCALERRMGLIRPMLSSLAKLAAQHAQSRWYEEALLTVGNFYYLRDDRAAYLRYFRQLHEAFPDGRHAPYAHWKVCWRAWLDDSPERLQLLAEHLDRFPRADSAAGALYWLGRLHEAEGRPAEAQGHYIAISEALPHYYYADLARARLRNPGRGTDLARRIRERLPPPRALAREPTAPTRALLEVGDALLALGLDDDARGTFQLVDYQQRDAYMAGLRLGRLHSRRDQHHLALRALKRYAFGYLRQPLGALDMECWRYLYPLGWQDALRARAGRHGLDPFLVAALIRQESEFHPGAKSRAGALGLMQIMPATGRGLFRRLGIPGFAARKLTVPDISLRLGTFHLKQVLARFDGEVEKALAGYNAGESRVPQWMRLGPFKEPAEFVETIPFSETRGYVQSVLRNRAMYERLYGG